MKHVTGWLWQFQWFRLLCIAAVVRGVACRWIGRNTPLLYAMRVRALEEGDYPLAAEAAALERASR